MGLMSEYIEKGMGANELEDELLKYIRLYNEVMGTYLMVYASAISKPKIPDIALNMDDYYSVFDVLRDVESSSLDFYIETPGGSGEAAEEIVRHLRSKFDNVNFVVSGEAKSAGTIMVLSGNEILMTESGSLGPIDAQMKIGRYQVSAYDYIQWVENKLKEAEKRNVLNPFDATMIAQISPGELSSVEHGLRFAEDLVVEWLAKYKFKDWKVTETEKKEVTDHLRVKRAKEIAKKLIDHAKWRSHGRSLKINDLEEIGLEIKRADDNPKLSEIIYRIQTILRMLFSTTNIYKIFATADEKLFKTAAPVGKPPKMPLTKSEVTEVATFETECQQCGKVHKVYAKFIKDDKIDEDLKKEGLKPYPSDNKLICDCGFEIDLSGIKNEIESQVGQKIVN